MGGGGACLRPVMSTMIARTMTIAVNPMMTRVSMPMAESPLVLLFPSPSFSSGSGSGVGVGVGWGSGSGSGGCQTVYCTDHVCVML